LRKSTGKWASYQTSTGGQGYENLHRRTNEGYENYNRPMFNAVAQQMLSGGHVALNPATLPDGLSQREYMDICLAMLRCADAIHMLHGWQESEGAVAEHAMAKKLGIKISYQFEGAVQ